MNTPAKSLSREFKVGLFVFISLLVVAAFSFRITDTPIFQSGTRITTTLDDASGLYKKSKVKMAGIDIGLVTDIRLRDGRAEIELTIDRGIDLPKGAQVVPRPLGILGDKYLDISLPTKTPIGAPGILPTNEVPTDPAKVPPSSSSWLRRMPEFIIASAYAKPVAQRLPSRGAAEKGLAEGDVIQSVNSGGSIEDLTKQLGDVAKDLKSISGNIRKLVEGNDLDSPLGRTLKNTEQLTGNLNKVVSENRGDMHTITASLAKLAKSLEEVSNEKSKDGLARDIRTLAKSADKLASTLQNIESITSKIDKGSGSLGKFVNDPTTASEFNKALLTLNSALDRAERTRIFLEAIPEYNFRAQEVKTYVGLRLAPRDNTAYIGQIVVRPQGSSKTTLTKTRTNGGPETVVETVETDTSGLAYSFQYAKRFWDTTYRVGLFESTGGVAIDHHFLNDGLRLSAELFDLKKGQKPNLKLVLGAHVMGIFVVQAGVEQTLSKTPFAFIGAGLSFSDEDLKTVLLLPGVP